jgi:23S rRNA (adenine2030-N6)-methyltransferase
VVCNARFLQKGGGIRVNYSHAFHAGNFADLVKHAVLLHVLGRLTAAGGPLLVIDTHAGRGLYDLASPEARKSGEAEQGVIQLMKADDTPAAFNSLKAAVRALNHDGEVRRYPGSPWLIANCLRPQDSYLACELKGDEHVALKAALRTNTNVRPLKTDGYIEAPRQTPQKGRVLVLIDPPFERPDDYGRIVDTLKAVKGRNPAAQALIWLPLKDLETFDAFLRNLEDALDCPMLIAQARMRPLTDPMKMNGCVLVLVDGPAIGAEMSDICVWTTAALGEYGAARVYGIG